MKKIRLGDVDLIAGLEWSAIRSAGPTQVSEKKALSSFLSSNKGASRGVVISVGDYTVVGRPDKKSKVPSGVPSAAALLAMANQKDSVSNVEGATEGTGEEHNWILIEQIEGKVAGFEDVNEPLFWLGMARNGLPVPGADLVVTRQGAIDELGDMLASASGATVFTTDREIRYNVVGQVSVVDKNFVDVIRSANLDRKAAHVKLFSTAGIIAAIVLITVVLSLGGWMGWASWSKSRAEALAKANAARDLASKQKMVGEEMAKYEAEVRAALNKGLSDGMKEVNDALAASSPYDLLEAWKKIIYDLPIYQATWNMTGIDCGMDVTIPMCTVKLVRGDLGTNRQLLNEHPDAIIEADAATYTIRGEELNPRQIDLPYLVSGVTFSKGLISDLQMLRMTGLAHTAAASQEVTKKVTLPVPGELIPLPTLPGGPADAAQAAAAPSSVTINLGFSKGEISLRGTGMWEISGVGRYLDLPNTRATSLTLNISSSELGSSSWTLTLDYMVRTLPSPIVPPVPVADHSVTIEIPEEFKSKVSVDGGVAETAGVATAPVGETSEAGDNGAVSTVQPSSSGTGPYIAPEVVVPTN